MMNVSDTQRENFRSKYREISNSIQHKPHITLNIKGVNPNDNVSYILTFHTDESKDIVREVFRVDISTLKLVYEFKWMLFINHH